MFATCHPNMLGRLVVHRIESLNSDPTTPVLHTPHVRHLLWTVITAMTAACSSIPSYQRPAAPIPAQFSGTSDGSAPAVPTGDVAWQSFIADPQLRRTIDLTLANNRDVQIAALRVEQLRAQYTITRSALLPSVDAGASVNASGSSRGNSNQWTASIGNTAYEVDFFGKLRSQNRQALEQYFASEEGRRSTYLTLVSQVATQYFTAQRAATQLALATQTLSAVQDSYQLTQALFNAGSTNELDLRSAEGQLQAAKINVLNFRRERAQAENGLVALAGTSLPADAMPTATLVDDGVLATVRPGLPSELLLRRPDILQAEHTLRAASANIGVARAAFFPSIRLTTSLSSASTDLSSLFGAGTGLWSFVPQISVPLFRGGANRANLASARIGARIEVANYEKAIQTAFREVADALVATENFTVLVRERTTQIAAQQRRYDIALLRYRSGEENYLSVLSAQQELYTAQQSRIDAQFNRLAGQLALYRALGGGWQ
jgi:outer membrane protein, multidrug efflux system